MTTITLLLAVLAGIGILLILILKFRIQAFIALLISSIAVGLLAGLDGAEIVKTIQTGMGSTLGFVATVVGLGAMFGAILEHSGGTSAVSGFLLQKLGEKKAPLALLLSGFVIAIPVFFDVAFIILVPVIYALQRKTKKSLLLYAIPLLSGLAIAHAFIPPTPGPVAVSEILGADLGWVILMGILTGIPTALVSGLFFGKYISKKIFIKAPLGDPLSEQKKLPEVGGVLTIIALPIFLILMNTLIKRNLFGKPEGFILSVTELFGHPFAALILANLLAWYFLGIKKGYSKKELYQVTTKSMMPAGTIILLTGAGGVFKQMLLDTGAGKALAISLADVGFPILLFAFLAAALVRIIQGSSTVAMITAAGLVAPLLSSFELDAIELASLVIAIASGASMLSHVNDSGFWLVSQYLGLSEKQTFRSWTVMTAILGIFGFMTVVFLNWIL